MLALAYTQCKQFLGVASKVHTNKQGKAKGYTHDQAYDYIFYQSVIPSEAKSCAVSESISVGAPSGATLELVTVVYTSSFSA